MAETTMNNFTGPPRIDDLGVKSGSIVSVERGEMVGLVNHSPVNF